jgi:hypothetical protein
MTAQILEGVNVSSRICYHSYETRCNPLASRVMPVNGNTTSGASPKQGTIHARPGKTGAALWLYRGLWQLVCLVGMLRFVQVWNNIRGRSILRLRLPEEQRISCKQRQSRARQNRLSSRVALMEGFMVTGAPVSCREIHAAARLG